MARKKAYCVEEDEGEDDLYTSDEADNGDKADDGSFVMDSAGHVARLSVWIHDVEDVLDSFGIDGGVTLEQTDDGDCCEFWMTHPKTEAIDISSHIGEAAASVAQFIIREAGLLPITAKGKAGKAVKTVKAVRKLSDEDLKAQIKELKAEILDLRQRLAVYESRRRPGV